MKLILDATVEGIASRADGTVKVTIGTQEIDQTQAASLFYFRGKFVKVFLTDNNVTPMEEAVITETVIQDGRKIKSKSQRFRSVCFRLHEQQNNGQTFDQFYDNIMEGLIADYKSKLE